VTLALIALVLVEVAIAVLYEEGLSKAVKSD